MNRLNIGGMGIVGRIGGVALLTLGFVIPQVSAGKATRVEAALWGHGELYDTVLTDTAFSSPPAHSTDTLYNFDMSGLGGQRSISASAPGDRDYNGGRWSVKRVVFTDQGVEGFDADEDGVVDEELSSAEEVLMHALMGDLTIHDTDVYFECPMLPRQNR